MNGGELKEQLLKLEPTLIEVAKKLEISKQTLDSRLSTADVKTGFIEQLSKIYNQPISFFFGENVGNITNTQNGNGVLQNAGRDANNAINLAEHDELIRLRVETKMLQERLAESQKAYETLHKSYEHLQKMNEFLMGNK